MTDENHLKGPQAIVRSLPSGSAVILRHYGDPNRGEIAKQLIAETRGRHIRVLIAGDVRLALRVGAHGIHVPEAMARHCALTWQNWQKPSWLVTAAAHSPKALLRAERLGAHAALLSPVFTTTSHPNSKPLGVIQFASWCRTSPLKIYALGGVTQANARRLKGCNIQGIAGISDFINNG
jgi:thiamine-phosphate pyrophosphorylase